MTIRMAQHRDKLRVLHMLKAAHAAAQLPFPFSGAYAARLFDQQTQLPDRCCIVSTDGNDVARGVLMASITEHPFGPFKMASEVAWWIDKSHRGISAPRMLDRYEKWAIDNGCHFAGMAAMSIAPAAQVIYLRRGYQPAEVHYLKKLT